MRTQIQIETFNLNPQLNTKGGKKARRPDMPALREIPYGPDEGQRPLLYKQYGAKNYLWLIQYCLDNIFILNKECEQCSSRNYLRPKADSESIFKRNIVRESLQKLFT